MSEILLASHCAPALAGIKPANIVSCFKSSGLKSDIEKLNNELNASGIYAEILCQCESRAVVIVYRKDVLERHLELKCHRDFLATFGYPETGTVSDYFDVLKKRLGCKRFPHEIGVFLGYPLNDVKSFINDPNEGCLLVGEWKVYHDREEAEKLFGRYNSCRKALVRQITERGKTLVEIFAAA